MNCYDKDAYLEKVRSHYGKMVDDREVGSIGPNEIKFILNRVAYYGVCLEENYEYVMENW